MHAWCTCSVHGLVHPSQQWSTQSQQCNIGPGNDPPCTHVLMYSCIHVYVFMYSWVRVYSWVHNSALVRTCWRGNTTHRRHTQQGTLQSTPLHTHSLPAACSCLLTPRLLPAWPGCRLPPLDAVGPREQQQQQAGSPQQRSLEDMLARHQGRPQHDIEPPLQQQQQQQLQPPTHHHHHPHHPHPQQPQKPWGAQAASEEGGPAHPWQPRSLSSKCSAAGLAAFGRKPVGIGQGGRL